MMCKKELLLSKGRTSCVINFKIFLDLISNKVVRLTHSKNVLGYSLAAFFAFSTFLLFWPGFYSNDSFVQLSQARSGNFSTWHPPFTALLMRGLYEICGVGGLLLLNQFLYWAGIWRFLILIKKNYLISLIIIGFFPPIYTLTLHVWKDAVLIVFFLWAVNFLLSLKKSGRHLDLFLYLLFSMLCILVRINAFIPIFVLSIIGYFYLKENFQFRTVLRSIVVSLLIVVFSISFSSILNKALNAKIDNPLPSLLLWDIAGIGNNAKIKIDLPDYASTKNLNKNFNWQNEYDPAVCSICWRGVNCNFPSKYNKNLIAEWSTLVLSHPKAYLKHRCSLAMLLYGLTPSVQYYPYHSFQQAMASNAEFHPSYLGLKAEESLNTLNGYLIKIHLYQYPIYFLISLFVLVTSIYKVKSRYYEYLLPIMLSSTGLVSAGSLFFISVAADYRYIAFSVFTSLLSLVSLFSLSSKK